MNISQIKTLCWLSAGLLGVGLCWSVWDGFQRKQHFPVLSKEEQLALLNSVKEPPPPRDELVDYERIKASFHALNWTGKPPAVAALPEAAGAEPAKPVAKPIASILKVIYVQVDRGDPKGSLAYVVYTEAGLSASTKTNLFVKEDDLRLGDRLPGAFSYASVAQITPEGVVFGFDDAQRELELVLVPDFSITGYIVQVGDGQAIVPSVTGLISKNSEFEVFSPAETTLIGSNRYRLGTEDVAVVGEDYARILAEDVRYVRHRDSRTGSYDGIEVKEVKSGSLAAKHGLESGDVIKSINGNPVSSVQDAINYVKTNSDTTSVWEVVIENKGRERTVSYESPSK